MTGCAAAFSGASKRFGNTLALDRLTLSIPRGLIYGMVGPNGSGKTTAIRGLMGLLRFDEGEAWVLGRQVPFARGSCRVSYMPQELAVYLELTVRENLEFFAEMSDEALTREGADRILDMVDLRSAADRMVGELSGGMRRRTSLACALIGDPDLVFLDEPTVGVDPELRESFWATFQGMAAAGRTVVLTTHYLDEAVHCHRVGLMRNGRLIADGTPSELLSRSGEPDLERAFLHFCRRGLP
jgi:ABC-2 type transport system ATP-binding protein